jgi:hypothetical protein
VALSAEEEESTLSAALDPPVALSAEEEESTLSAALDPPVALSAEEEESTLSPPSSLPLLLLLSPLLLLLLLLALLALPIRCVISSALDIPSSSLGLATAPPIGMPITTAPVASRSAINAGAWLLIDMARCLSYISKPFVK